MAQRTTTVLFKPTWRQRKHLQRMDAVSILTRHRGMLERTENVPRRELRDFRVVVDVEEVGGDEATGCDDLVDVVPVRAYDQQCRRGESRTGAGEKEDGKRRGGVKAEDDVLEPFLRHHDEPLVARIRTPASEEEGQRTSRRLEKGKRRTSCSRSSSE
jgi:hypothetical protein